MDTLIIIWAAVIAIALVLELITCDLYTSWFCAGGLAALIMAACGVDVHWQVIVFVVLSVALLVSLRPIFKRMLQVQTTYTNLDANVGKEFKLLENVKEGLSTIRINDVIWTVKCNAALKAGADVVVTGTDGNKYVVEKKKEDKK